MANPPVNVAFAVAAGFTLMSFLYLGSSSAIMPALRRIKCSGPEGAMLLAQPKEESSMTSVSVSLSSDP